VIGLQVRPVTGLPRLGPGDDLAALLLHAVGPLGLSDGDVLCVSSKAIAKTEGRSRAADRDDVVDEETDRLVARRGPLRVVRTRHGLVLAAAGVDASNTEPGTVVPLPVDPDASARMLRAALHAATGRNVAVVVTDTAGRAWREGQTDVAVGCAGLPPLVDLAGQTDGFGTVLAVTAPAVADEVAGAAELVLGKDALTPAAVATGLGHLVLAPGAHGPGAAALVRPEADDLFGFGALDAVWAAVRRGPTDRRGFARGDGELTGLVSAAADGVPLTVVFRPGDATVEARGDAHAAGVLAERLRVLAWAHGHAVKTGPKGHDPQVWTWLLTPAP
jgi:coenzyme F420-0:L-glutamate ligase/coenzyme F420-1:gamma-L-glutamate ligase